jgi:hypothetical protein
LLLSQRALLPSEAERKEKEKKKIQKIDDVGIGGRSTDADVHHHHHHHRRGKINRSKIRE